MCLYIRFSNLLEEGIIRPKIIFKQLGLLITKDFTAICKGGQFPEPIQATKTKSLLLKFKSKNLKWIQMQQIHFENDTFALKIII